MKVFVVHKKHKIVDDEKTIEGIVFDFDGLYS